MNVLHKDPLVLEHITLGLHVQFMVHVVIDLFGLTVFPQHSSQNSHTPNPDGFLWHTSISRTLSFTISTVSALSSSFVSFSNSGTAVYNLGLLDDQAIFNKLTDILACWENQTTKILTFTCSFNIIQCLSFENPW